MVDDDDDCSLITTCLQTAKLDFKILYSETKVFGVKYILNVMKRQRCDPSFVPKGNLDCHQHTGITTVTTPRVLEKRRDFKYADGRVLNKNMVSVDNPFETNGARYRTSKNLLGVQINSNEKRRVNTCVSNFFTHFGDGGVDDCNAAADKSRQRGNSSVNKGSSSSRNKEIEETNRSSPIVSAHVCSNMQENSLPIGPYVESEINGWCVPYKAKGMKPSSENNLRGISKEAPGWFHVQNSRINEKTSKCHRLRINGRKEQVMSNSVPDFFVGERVSLEEMNKGRGSMKGRRQNSVMKSKIYEKNKDLPKNHGRRCSPTASSKNLRSKLVLSPEDLHNDESDALDNFLQQNGTKKLACSQNFNTNNSDGKSNASLAAILRDGQVSSNKPEWMHNPWSEKRPTITRPRQPSMYGKKVKVAIDSNSMKVEQKVCKNVSFSGLWTLGYPNIHR